MPIPEINERAVLGGNNPPIPEVMAEKHHALLALVDPLAVRADDLPRQIKCEKDLEKIGVVVTDCKSLAKKIEGIRKFEKQPHLDAGKEVDNFFNPVVDRLDRITDTFEAIATKYQREKVAEERRKAEDEAAKLRADAEKKRQEAEAAKRGSTAARKNDEADHLLDQADEAEAAAFQSAASIAKLRTESGVTAGAKTNWDFSIVDYDKIDLNKLRPFFRREDVEKAIRSMVRIQKGSALIEGVKVFENVKATFRI
ncbi:hypothetical protein LJR231_001811 [Phyllobacterium sp. LjRoot231]|uniref:hypothetical protein n=1 Tax=Phyllobacterium sp. LjRoot231 TaxID=3342289 RepID=UPI003ED0B91E